MKEPSCPAAFALLNGVAENRSAAQAFDLFAAVPFVRLVSMLKPVSMTRLILVSATIHLVQPGMGLSQDSTLIHFEIEDQFDRVYTHESWQDSILIVFGSDKDGAVYNVVWARAINDTLNKEFPGLPVRQVGLADLSGVPFFLTGIVRGGFPDDRDKWALMDWDGEFPESYGFVEEHCNILVFSIERSLLFQTAVTDLEPEKLGMLIDKIRSSLPVKEKGGAAR